MNGDAALVGRRGSSEPRWWFHGTLAAVLLLYLLGLSTPGPMLALWLGPVGVVALLGLVWFVRVVAFARRASTGRAGGAGGAWFAVVPAMAAVAFALTLADVPLRARWVLSRDAFEAVVPRALAAPASYDDGAEQVLGLYTVDEIYRARDAVVFHVRTATAFSDAGFAYLPGGPRRDVPGLGSPDFVDLGGHWYAWTSAW